MESDVWQQVFGLMTNASFLQPNLLFSLCPGATHSGFQAVAIHGLKNAIMANSVRFAPRSLVVKITRKIQAKKY
jgi:hypothetical protein